MKIINITFCCEKAEAHELRHLLKHELIPLSRDVFHAHKLMRVTSPQQDPQLESYALHLEASDAEEAQKWFSTIGERWLETLQRTRNERIVWFATQLEIVDD